MRSLAGLTCVVTGAKKSIGFGVAERYCQAGAKVALLDVDPGVMESAELLRSQGYEAHGWVVNITDKEAVDQAFPGSDYYEDSVAISDFQNLSFIAHDAL